MYADIHVALPLAGPFTYLVPENMKVSKGARVKVPFGKKNLTGFVVNVHDKKPDFDVKEIIELYDEEPVFDERMIHLAEYVSSDYISSIGEALSVALPSGTSSRNRFKKPYEKNSEYTFQLTDEQSSVRDEILKSYSNGENSHLVFGVTGSGKTELYISVAKEIISSGRSVIYLVPEISLSSQIYERLYKVFGDELVIYHSALTVNQRLENWIRFYKGEAKIAIGTRSAVFMQAPSLGMIIIDEEHDSSYKEHSTPRYNARRVALYRAKRENTLVVMGSATPSVESLYAAEKGVLKLHKLVNRYGDATFPDIEIVKVSPSRPEHMLSTRLKLFTKREIDRGKQAIYLLNRRGFSPIVLCDNCGEKLQCPDCNISLNFHRDGSLVCHYCGHKRELPKKCPRCASDKLIKLGSGTQRIEEVVEKEFPAFRIFRLDQDTSAKKDALVSLIDDMKNGEIDLILGTQMVSKGFDFRNVTLVGVLLADIGMNLPDFRATERIFSLLLQVSGRSGRGDDKGRVIIQTLNDDIELYDFLKKHDYYSFYRRELETRRVLEYPPFSRIVRLLIRGRDEAKVEKYSNDIASFAEKILSDEKMNVTLLGPAPAPMERIGGNYRHHLILKSKKVDELRRLARRINEKFKLSDAYLEIDVDPYDML